MNEACRRTQCSKTCMSVDALCAAQITYGSQSAYGADTATTAHPTSGFHSQQRSELRNRGHATGLITGRTSRKALCARTTVTSGPRRLLPTATIGTLSAFSVLLCFVYIAWYVCACCALGRRCHIPSSVISGCTSPGWLVAPAASSSGGRPRGAAAGAAVISSSRHMAQP